MGGGKGGGGGTAASETQARLAEQLFKQSGPLRDLLFGVPGTGPVGAVPRGGFFDREGTFIETSPDVAATPGTPGAPGMLENLLRNPPGAPFERDVLESQFGRARENLLGSTPIRGGQLGSSLANLEAQRALGVTGLEQAQQQRQMENIFRTAGLTTGQTQLSLGGLGQAGGTLAAAGAASQQAQASMLGGLGTGLGILVGMGKQPGAQRIGK